MPFALILAVGACAAKYETTEVTYECIGMEAPLHVTFFKVDPPRAILTFAQRELDLVQGVSGSGARYVDQTGTTIFWIKGDKAAFSPDGDSPLTCVTLDQT